MEKFLRPGVTAKAEQRVWQIAAGPPYEVWGYWVDGLSVAGLTFLQQYPSGIAATPGAVWVILDEPSELVRLVIETG